ncbi:hypothetical protein PVAP13_4KG137500 [Panicum virgatum]|uniref:Uncharacterized protein n=1 Tax=Panicum virgatum TaxID=38727 RepID=A0A8T0TMT2_PANVG|nr:hypothetical protein PVAP13_4KG137500 [Panicum virgatum]KAG2611508.1 hypothetical protein PVAP13_4KG137500 [Panicum virgatum]
MSSSSSDLVRQRQRAVEVYLPEEVQGEGEVGSSVASTAAGSAASTAPDIASLVEKALAKLPPEMAAEAKDPKRKFGSSSQQDKKGLCSNQELEVSSLQWRDLARAEDDDGSVWWGGPHPTALNTGSAHSCRRQYVEAGLELLLVNLQQQISSGLDE